MDRLDPRLFASSAENCLGTPGATRSQNRPLSVGERPKKTAPEEIPRGGVVFLSIGADPIAATGPEVNHGGNEPGHSNGGDSHHDCSSPFECRTRRLKSPFPVRGSGCFNQQLEGTPVPSIAHQDGSPSLKGKGCLLNFLTPDGQYLTRTVRVGFSPKPHQEARV